MKVDSENEDKDSENEEDSKESSKDRRKRIREKQAEDEALCAPPVTKCCAKTNGLTEECTAIQVGENTFLTESNGECPEGFHEISKWRAESC